MAYHSQKWHDWSRSTSSRSSDGIATITSKLDSLGRDKKKLKENVQVIQVGCEIYGGTHLDKECLLNEEVNELRKSSMEPITRHRGKTRMDEPRMVKFGHTNIEKSLKNIVLNEWVLGSFDTGSNSSGISNEPYSRDLQKYSSEFENKITQLANEYELRIGKKGYILDDICEKGERVYGGKWNHGMMEDLRKKRNGNTI
ncbi:hypothetical protein Tco_0786731 [Tanacetum coccineum]